MQKRFEILVDVSHLKSHIKLRSVTERNAFILDDFMPPFKELKEVLIVLKKVCTSSLQIWNDSSKQVTAVLKKILEVCEVLLLMFL